MCTLFPCRGALVSLEEYLTTVFDSDVDYVDGELIERNVGESEHSALQVIISAIFVQSAEAGRNSCLPRTATVLTTNNPDISLSLDEISTALAAEIEQ